MTIELVITRNGETLCKESVDRIASAVMHEFAFFAIDKAIKLPQTPAEQMPANIRSRMFNSQNG